MTDTDVSNFFLFFWMRERKSYLPNRLNWAGEDLGCGITVKRVFLKIAKNMPVLLLSQRRV